MIVIVIEIIINRKGLTKDLCGTEWFTLLREIHYFLQERRYKLSGAEPFKWRSPLKAAIVSIDKEDFFSVAAVIAFKFVPEPDREESGSPAPVLDQWSRAETGRNTSVVPTQIQGVWCGG
ncbi:hypothetical protein CEXT_685191 [Caerostris extrusa]|uniref:Uncharacterized protein n=1 Tax=Caerostris extrusa TaxID=172846 RepID=A0AAV4Q1Z0_CAEEX|nr:hypothetical protein CEXT_685191 [Caerostris extrusa]